MIARQHALAYVVLLFVMACSSTDTGSGSDETAAERACLDTVEAFSRLAERCGAEYERTYDENLELFANGDCKNVLAVRDETKLRSTCLPAVSAESCVDFRAAKTDPSCSQQLQRKRTQ